MKLEEWLALALGGGLLWRLGPVVRRYFAPPGPILALSSVNMQGRDNAVWPRVLEVVGLSIALSQPSGLCQMEPDCIVRIGDQIARRKRNLNVC
jgi:hypothetical protein